MHARFVTVLALAVLGGCCGLPAPPAAKFFDRSSALDTLKGFVYAIDTHQWDFAYDCLSPASQAEIGRFKFEAVIRWANDPHYHEVPLIDLISDSVLHVEDVAVVGRRADITVTPRARNSDGIPCAFGAHLLFVKDDEDIWRFDFLETINAIQGSHAQPPRDVSSR